MYFSIVNKAFLSFVSGLFNMETEKKVVQQIPGYQEGKVTGICNCNTVLQK